MKEGEIKNYSMAGVHYMHMQAPGDAAASEYR